MFTMEASQPHLIDLPWSHHWLSSTDERLLSYCWQDPYHWMQFPDLVDFRMSVNATAISGYPLPGIPVETIEHLFLDQVLPRCLAHQGKIMLHASAVKLEQGVILFIGDSGAGKSTMAGNFHQAGNPAVSDDCVWIKESHDKIVAVPTYGGLRLWGDSLQVLFSSEVNTAPMAHYSSKRRVQPDENRTIQMADGNSIMAVILLASGNETASSAIHVERLPNREAFIAILKQTFQLDVLDVDRMTNHIEALGRIVPRLKVFRLSMPHDYTLLPLVRQKILEAVL